MSDDDGNARQSSIGYAATDTYMASTEVLVALLLVSAVSSLVVAFFNALFVIQLFRQRSMWKKQEVHLIYYRFFVDAALGLTTLVYNGVLVFEIFAHGNHISSRSVVLSRMPSLNFFAMRNVISLFIAVFRVVAVFLPMRYRQIAHAGAAIVGLMGSALYGVFGDFVLFAICQYDFEDRVDCQAFACMIPPCFANYWGVSNSSVNFVVSLSFFLFIVKLAARKNSDGLSGSSFSKMNRLLSFDLTIIVLFACIPALLSSAIMQSFFPVFKGAGPFVSTTGIVGCAIETLVGWRICKPCSRQKFTESGRSTGVVKF